MARATVADVIEALYAFRRKAGVRVVNLAYAQEYLVEPELIAGLAEHGCRLLAHSWMPRDTVVFMSTDAHTAEDDDDPMLYSNPFPVILRPGLYIDPNII